MLSYVYADPALFLTFLTRSFYPSSGPIVVSFEFVNSRDFSQVDLSKGCARNMAPRLSPLGKRCSVPV